MGGRGSGRKPTGKTKPKRSRLKKGAMGGAAYAARINKLKGFFRKVN